MLTLYDIIKFSRMKEDCNRFNLYDSKQQRLIDNSNEEKTVKLSLDYQLDPRSGDVRIIQH